MSPLRMVAMYRGGVPIVFAEGAGRRVAESLALILDRLGAAERGRVVVHWYDGPYPLEGEALAESTRAYHEVVCPVADGEVIVPCERCAKPDELERSL